MQKSLYFEQVSHYFPNLVLSIVEKFNEKSSEAQAFPYLFRQLLTPSYASDGRWASITANYTNVAADVVALDSPLPVKSRDSIEQVTGEIPKLGMKLPLKEKDMKDIENMSAQLAAGNEMMKNLLIQRIFEDTPRVIRGIYEKIEDIFLAELSTGVGIAERDNGTGIRLNVGYKAENQFGVEANWVSDAENAKPMTDVNKVLDKAEQEDGNLVTDLWADDTWLRAFYKSKEAREEYAFLMNFVGQAIPNLDFNKAAAIFADKGITLHRIARRVNTESNGVRNYHNPWKKGVAVFTCDQTLGSLVWTTCAEQSRPVEGVVYQTVENFILVSKYSKNEPLAEFTASQAMVVPVVNNVDRIYTLDCQKVANAEQLPQA